MVLMHLVEVYLVIVGAKELLPDFAESHLAVAQLPVSRGRPGDGGAEQTAEELVAEADACEVHFGMATP